jgi:hypothetical protein
LKRFFQTLAWFVLVMFLFSLVLKSLDAPTWYELVSIAGLSVVFVLVARRR